MWSSKRSEKVVKPGGYVMKLFGRKTKKEKNLKAYVSGKAVPISEVNDPVFSSGTLGDGIGIYPENESICAPCDGVIPTIAEDSKHAIGITAENGAEILIHIGIDTVSLEGRGFEVFVCEGKKVKQGQKLLKFDKALIESKGLEATCILVLTNMDEFSNATFISGKKMVQNESVICNFE